MWSTCICFSWLSKQLSIAHLKSLPNNRIFSQVKVCHGIHWQYGLCRWKLESASATPGTCSLVYSWYSTCTNLVHSQTHTWTNLLLQTYCSSESTNLLPHEPKPEAPKCMCSIQWVWGWSFWFGSDVQLGLQTRYLMLIQIRNSSSTLCHLEKSTNIQTLVIVVEALWIGSKVTLSPEMLIQHEMSCHFMW